MFKHFYFHPSFGEDEPNLTSIFFRWGEKPPTSRSLSRDSDVSLPCTEGILITWAPQLSHQLERRTYFSRQRIVESFIPGQQKNHKTSIFGKTTFLVTFCWLVASLWLVVVFLSPKSHAGDEIFFFSPIHGTKNPSKLRRQLMMQQGRVAYLGTTSKLSVHLAF